MSLAELTRELKFELTAEERSKFERLEERILARLTTDGGRVTRTCGAVLSGNRRMIEFFGRVRIPADEFLAEPDELLLAEFELHRHCESDEAAKRMMVSTQEVACLPKAE